MVYTKKIKKFRAELNDLISHIEVNIDFPEYNDIEVMTKNKIEKKLKNQITELKKIIEQSEDRQIGKRVEIKSAQRPCHQQPDGHQRLSQCVD